jgi:hypothetical protein
VLLTERIESLETIALHNQDLLTRLLALSDCPLKKEISHTEMLETINKRFDQIEKSVLPNAARGAGTLSSASAGGKARSAKYKPLYQEARRFIREYHRKHPAISFSQARKRAAQHVDLSESALKNHIRKKDFSDW